MPHTDTSKSQATNRTSYHASHRYQQVTGHLANQFVHLTMPHTDTSKSQATNRTSYHASQIPANHRQQIVHLTMPHTDTSKSQATNRISYHGSDSSKRQSTSRASCFAYLDMPHTDASHRYQQVTGNRSYILPCLTETPANHRQQIVHLTMPHIDTSKSQATNRASYNASYRYQKITGHLANKSYILPCPMLIPANHRQQIVHLAMPHTNTCRSLAASRASYHSSHRYQ